MDDRIVEVAAALIVREGRFLICRRPEHKARGGLWEFPGVKTEAGESVFDAVVRECREELGVTIVPSRVVDEVTHTYPDITVRLSLVLAVIAEGEPMLLEHSALAWISPSDIPRYDFCPADYPMLSRLSLATL